MGSRGQASGASSAITRITGRKGKQKSIDDAQSGTNPNFRKLTGYDINCQRCVVAYEMRRRGYDVEALPRANNEGNYSWRRGFEGQRWLRLGARRYQQSIDLLESEVKSWGDGARGIVYVQWNQSSAHVFNVENRKGVVVYVDGQTNNKNYSADVHMRGSMPTKTMVSRVDNLKLKADNLEKVVKKRGT